VNGNEVLLGNFGSFGDSRGNVGTLRDTDTNAVLAVTHNNECAKTEAATAFYYAGNAVDVQNALVKLLLFGSNFGATTIATTVTAALTATVSTAVALVAATLATLALALRGLVLLSSLCFGCCSGGCSVVLSHD
jgi:hypothetical protein